MNPLLLGVGANLVSGLLGGLFGGSQSQQAAKRQREYRANVMRIADPNYLRMLQNMLYNQALASPAFSQASRGIFNAGSNLTNRLSGSLAARGLSNSGVGAIAPALAGSSMAGQLGNLRSNAYGQAGNEAGMLQSRQLAALQGLGPEQNFNYGGQAIGGSLSDIGRYLLDYYGQKAGYKPTTTGSH